MRLSITGITGFVGSHLAEYALTQGAVDQYRVDPARLRPSDVPVLRGSAETIAKGTGWRPRIPFDQTLADLLEYWRQRIPARSR
jgi:nucleoside-diphosphate-sugar epimerase